MATKEPKEFKAEYLKELDETPFEPALVAWINDITINTAISIE